MEEIIHVRLTVSSRDSNGTVHIKDYIEWDNEDGMIEVSMDEENCVDGIHKSREFNVKVIQK